MSIMDEIILDVVTLDEIKFVAFCYMCLLSVVCVLYQHYVFYLNLLNYALWTKSWTIYMY